MSAADLSDFASRPCPDWYRTPQLGVFVHWGVFSVPAFAPAGVSIADLMRSDYDRFLAVSPYAEWYWNAMRFGGAPTQAHHRERYGDRPYEDFAPRFEAAAAASWDAEAWADLFSRAGAGYVVLVTKHHDGYCLWPSAIANPHMTGWGSARDYVGELAAAVRAKGMRFGVYYSGGLDWTFRHIPIGNFGDLFACAPVEADYRAYALAQVRELIARYRPSVLWNDIAWPAGEDLPGLFADYYAAVPDGVVNDRWLAQPLLFESLRDASVRAGFNAMIRARIEAGEENQSPPPPHADFRTVEYAPNFPPGGKKWEACRGLGLAFGYNQEESPDDLMSGDELIALYRSVTGDGGNLLINVGPMAGGGIPQEQSRPLLELGRFLAGAAG